MFKISQILMYMKDQEVWISLCLADMPVNPLRKTWGKQKSMLNFKKSRAKKHNNPPGAHEEMPFHSGNILRRLSWKK